MEQDAQSARDAAVEQSRQSEATRESNISDTGQGEREAFEIDRAQRQAQDDAQHRNEDDARMGRAAQREQESQKASEEAGKSAGDARAGEKAAMDKGRD